MAARRMREVVLVTILTSPPPRRGKARTGEGKDERGRIEHEGSFSGCGSSTNNSRKGPFCCPWLYVALAWKLSSDKQYGLESGPIPMTARDRRVFEPDQLLVLSICSLRQRQALGGPCEFASTVATLHRIKLSWPVT